METEPITKFSGDHEFLSNFYEAEINTFGLKWKTSEHLYQALKTKNPIIMSKINSLPTPGAAKRYGQKIETRDDWESFKIKAMDFVLSLKFQQNLDIRQKLLDTGDCEIVEGNNWGDTFWGIDESFGGENHLGKLLMKLREEIK